MVTYSVKAFRCAPLLKTAVEPNLKQNLAQVNTINSTSSIIGR